MSRTNTTIWREDDRVAQDTTNGSGAMSVTFDPQGAAYIEEIRLALDIAGTQEDFTVDLDSGTNALNDTNLITQDMTDTKDYRCSDRIILNQGDKLVFTWTNTDNRTYGLEIIYRRYLT